MSEFEEVKPALASLVANIAREECKKLYEKRLAGLEEELAAVYKRLDEYTLCASVGFDSGSSVLLFLNGFILA